MDFNLDGETCRKVTHNLDECLNMTKKIGATIAHSNVPFSLTPFFRFKATL